MPNHALGGTDVRIWQPQIWHPGYFDPPELFGRIALRCTGFCGFKSINYKVVDLAMGYFNTIWQGDMNVMSLLSFLHCSTPAKIINLTGPETFSVKQVTLKFGRFLGKMPQFSGREAPTTLLSNAAISRSLFGQPKVLPEQIIRRIANWINHKNSLLNKQTHYEVSDGKH